MEEEKNVVQEEEKATESAPETKEVPAAKEGNAYAILAYLWMLCLIPLLLKKDDEFVLFHAKQGLILFIIEVAVGIVGVIPLLGWLIVMLGTLVCGALSIIGIIQVLMGNKWKMPIIGDWAEKVTI